MKERLLRWTGPWNGRRIAMTAVSVIIGAAVAFAANVWIIARFYQGTEKFPEDAAVAIRPGFDSSGDFAANGSLQGMLLWFLITAVGAAILTQLVLFGPRALLEKVFSIPARLRSWWTPRDRLPAALLFGAASTLIVSGILIPSLRGVLALGVLIFLPFGIGRALVTVLTRFIVALATSTSKQAIAPEATAGTWILGAGLGMMGAFLLPPPLHLVLAAVLLVLAIYGSSTRTPAMNMLLFAAAAAVAVDWLTASAVLADDGGWKECVGDDGSWTNLKKWGEYLSCDGTEWIHRDSPWFTGPPGACGGLLGSACGGKKPPPKPPDDKPPPKPDEAYLPPEDKPPPKPPEAYLPPEDKPPPKPDEAYLPPEDDQPPDQGGDGPSDPGLDNIQDDATYVEQDEQGRDNGWARENDDGSVDIATDNTGDGQPDRGSHNPRDGGPIEYWEKDDNGNWHRADPRDWQETPETDQGQGGDGAQGHEWVRDEEGNWVLRQLGSL